MFQFDVEVAGDARFYAFEVGGIDGPTVSRDDLEAMDWQLEIAP